MTIDCEGFQCNQTPTHLVIHKGRKASYCQSHALTYYATCIEYQAPVVLIRVDIDYLKPAPEAHR